MVTDPLGISRILQCNQWRWIRSGDFFSQSWWYMGRIRVGLFASGLGSQERVLMGYMAGSSSYNVREN